MKIEKLSKYSRDIILEEDKNGCLVCLSHCKDEYGYTKIIYKGKQERLHRVIYEMNYGEIPKGMVIRHKCDNPNCCNIDHLEIGTHQDNSNDMVKRGRSVKGRKYPTLRGTNNVKNKLSDNDVKEIYLSKLGYRKLSKIYNVSPSSIKNIKKKKLWNWLTDTLD